MMPIITLYILAARESRYLLGLGGTSKEQFGYYRHYRTLKHRCPTTE